ncbi:MAG: type I restriction-modification system subunit M [Paludibacteraceae bacterium]|nr:type I restriction-modification system subunit M [Paludibacteraceae bacterium]
MAFEQALKNIDNKLRVDEGCGSELDYVEQTSWILFLKYLDDLDKTRQLSAELSDEEYKPIIAEGYRWNDWAMPLDANGKYDISSALVGDDLIEFVNGKLFPYLRKFKETASDTHSIEYKIGVIFSDIHNRLQSGYNLRDVIEQVNELQFQTSEQKHELTYFYESRLNNMGNAGRNGGEYYTPRPLIRTIVNAVAPKIGETVYDGACGSCGFLCEAYNYMHKQVEKTADEEKLQTTTFYGKEVKPLAYIIANMNMILHGIESPNIIRTNTLTENLADVQEKDRFDCILANPPFGGKERAQVQQNFPIKTSETAYLFLQHFIKYLRAGGKAGIVIKNTFLSNTDNASVELRKKLLSECNLHTVLDLPSGVFQAGVKTVVLFFKKGEPTRKVWFYQLNLDRTLGKTNPLNENDLADFLKLQKDKVDSENSWSVNVADLNENYDLSVKNPNKVEVIDERTPEQIANEIKTLAEDSQRLLNEIIEML